MAEAKKKRVLKKTETVREKAVKKDQPVKTRRLSDAKTAVGKPLGAAKKLGQKEYHPIKLPDNKVGNFMTKPRKFTPKFFREAWGELKLVTWPNRRETMKLTLAVFIFAITFGIMIAVVDFGLDKVFKDLLLK